MTDTGKQSVKRRIGNTAKVRRGLQHIVALVSNNKVPQAGRKC